MRLEVSTEFEQKASFEEYFDHVVSFARQTIVDDGAHAAVLIVTEGTRTAVYDIGDFYRDDDPGRVALNGALATRYKGEANWFIHIVEAWAGKLPTQSGEEFVRPSQHPERIEILGIDGVRRDGERRQSSFRIVRNTAGRVTGTELHSDSSKFLSILEHPLFGGATREFEGARLVVEDD